MAKTKPAKTSKKPVVSERISGMFWIGLLAGIVLTLIGILAYTKLINRSSAKRPPTNSCSDCYTQNSACMDKCYKGPSKDVFSCIQDCGKKQRDCEKYNCFNF